MPAGPPDLSDTARSFATLAARLRHAAPTVTAEGLPVDADPTNTAIYVHHWPASGETVEHLPEGAESTDVREGSAFSSSVGDAELLVGDESTGVRADSLLHGGIEYEVITSSPRVTGSSGAVTWSTFVAIRVLR